MNTRTNLTIVIAALLLAFASVPPSAKAFNLLVDPDFNGVPPLNSAPAVLGPPFLLGQWGAENGAIVGVDGGVTPLTAPTMLAEYAPSTGSYTQTYQATDVSADPAGSTYTLSAFFNANQNLSAAHAFVNMTFYDASYTFLGGPPSSGLFLDNNTATWQQISVTATEPANTKYVLSQVLYDNSTLLDSAGVSDPSYVDAASLTLKPVPEPASLALLAAGAVCLLGCARRNMKKTRRLLAFVSLFVMSATVSTAFGQPSTIIVDEFGGGSYNGAPLASGLVADPYNGNTLQFAYTLPFPYTYSQSPVADIQVFEPAGSTQPSDMLRFMRDTSGAKTILFFYSDAMVPGDAADSPADVQAIPNPVVTYATGTETGLFGNAYSEAGPNGLLYSINNGPPGWDGNPNGTNYTFISEGRAVPEPGAVALLAVGAIGPLGWVWRRRSFQKNASKD